MGVTMVKFSTQRIAQSLRKGLIKPMLNMQTGKPMSSTEMAQVFSQVGNKETTQYSYGILNSIGNMRINTIASEKIQVQSTVVFFESKYIKNKETLNQMKELTDICFYNIGINFGGFSHPDDTKVSKSAGVDIEYEYDINGQPYNVKRANMASVKILCDLMTHFNFECTVRHGGKDTVISPSEYYKLLQNYLQQQKSK